MLNKYVCELIWMVSMTSQGKRFYDIISKLKKHYFYVSLATCPIFFWSSFYNESLT